MDIGKHSIFNVRYMYLASAKAALHADSQIAVLKYMHCQNLQIDTTSTSKYICKCSVCYKTWYES